MLKLKLILCCLTILYTVKSLAFIEILERGVNYTENALIYTDAATELIESIDDGGDTSSEEVKNASQNLKKISEEMRDLGYTSEDIKDIIQSGGLDSRNLAGSISKMSQRIRKTKNLLKKVGILAVAKPEAVTAGESLKSTAILSDIHYELKLARLDRMKDRQSEELEKIKSEKMQKEEKKLFIDQLVLMQRRNSKNQYAFNSFKFSNLNEE